MPKYNSFDEAQRNVLIKGYTVDHIMDGMKTVAVRMSDRHYDNDPKVDLVLQDMETLKPVYGIFRDMPVNKAARLVNTFLAGERVRDPEYFSLMINQGMRQCEVVKTTPTRIRVEYEMPNAGIMGGWQYYADIDGQRYVSGY